MDYVMSFFGTGGTFRNVTTPAYAPTYSSEVIPLWSPEIMLQIGPSIIIQPQMQPGSGQSLSLAPAAESNDAAAIWMPVTIPADAAVFAFNFSFSGEPSNDVFVASIAGTNLFVLEAEFIPTNASVGSGPIDVTEWAGQTVEFFFGLLGGTSSNAQLTVNGMRFYELQPPDLKAEQVGDRMRLEWSVAAEDYQLEQAADLSGAGPWQAVTNPPVLSDLQHVVTNDASGPMRFYRLRRP
jgi:hypothetical protein